MPCCRGGRLQTADRARVRQRPRLQRARRRVPGALDDAGDKLRTRDRRPGQPRPNARSRESTASLALRSASSGSGRPRPGVRRCPDASPCRGSWSVRGARARGAPQDTRQRRAQIRRRRLPGVTAAATTAVFATGAGPGVTALATTAVFATGAPMTPTLPTRARLTGMIILLRSRLLRRLRLRR